MKQDLDHPRLHTRIVQGDKEAPVPVFHHSVSHIQNRPASRQCHPSLNHSDSPSQQTSHRLRLAHRTRLGINSQIHRHLSSKWASHLCSLLSVAMAAVQVTAARTTTRKTLAEPLPLSRTVSHLRRSMESLTLPQRKPMLKYVSATHMRHLKLLTTHTLGKQTCNQGHSKWNTILHQRCPTNPTIGFTSSTSTIAELESKP